MTRWRPDAAHWQRQEEARVIEAKVPGWSVLYGAHSRVFWAFGSVSGKPIAAQSASELLGVMLADERSQSTAPREDG